jgi:hypothetical protein
MPLQMSRRSIVSKKICVSVLGLLLFAFLLVQVNAQTSQPKEALIGIYNIAPGKHLEFLKWMAAREQIASEAGAAATQWYAHRDGASWDYIAIGPVLSDEMSKKIDDMSAKKNLTIGFKASLEFRQYVSSHTDTYAMGPVSAADLVKAAEK